MHTNFIIAHVFTYYKDRQRKVIRQPEPNLCLYNGHIETTNNKNYGLYLYSYCKLLVSYIRIKNILN